MYRWFIRHGVKIRYKKYQGRALIGGEHIVRSQSGLRHIYDDELLLAVL